MRQENENKIRARFPFLENSKPYIIIGLGFLVIFVSGYQLVTGVSGNILDPEKGSNGSGAQNNAETVIPNVDSDADGLTDWEEERVYHTNALKPDSDLDGHNDGIEVRTGHDPLVHSNKPTGTASATATPADSEYYQYNRLVADTSDDLSKINDLSNSVLSTQKTEADTSLDGRLNSIATLALANTAIAEKDVIPVVKDSEIKITNNSGKEAIQTYVVALASMGLQSSPVKDSQSVISYLSAALSGDTTKVQEIIRLSDEGVKQLKALPVPAEMVASHKLAIGLFELAKTTAASGLNFSSLTPEQILTLANQMRVLQNGGEGLLTDVQAVMQKYNITVDI